jgi:hypothetical protein
LRREGGENGFSPSLFKRGGRGVSSKGTGFARIPRHFVISPCPVKDVGHDQPRGRGNSYALSPRERVGVRARKTENYFGFSIIKNFNLLRTKIVKVKC